jgi:hypothetical protein
MMNIPQLAAWLFTCAIYSESISLVYMAGLDDTGKHFGEMRTVNPVKSGKNRTPRERGYHLFIREDFS